MDLIAGLRSELLRPLVTLVIPGAIAIAPFTLLGVSSVTEVGEFAAANASAFTTLLVLTAITAGLVLEDIGARIEILIDWHLKRDAEFTKLVDEWRQYLRTKANDQVIGQRYLRTIVVRMKFELSCAPALLAHAIGLNWANERLSLLTSTEITGITTFLVVLAVYLLYEARSSAAVLARVRRDIIGSSPQVDAFNRAYPVP